MFLAQIPIRPERPRLAPGKWSQVPYCIRRLEVSAKTFVRPRSVTHRGVLLDANPVT